MKVTKIGSYLCYLLALLWLAPLLGGREQAFTALAMDDKDEKKDDEKPELPPKLRSNKPKENHVDKENEKEEDESEEEKKDQEKEEPGKEDKKGKETKVEINQEAPEAQKEEASGAKEEVVTGETDVKKSLEEELEEFGATASAPEEDTYDVTVEIDLQGDDESKGAISKLTSAFKKLACINSLRAPSMMLLGKEESKEEEHTDRDTLQSAFKPVACLDEGKSMVEYVNELVEDVADGLLGEVMEDVEESKKVPDADRNNIVEGPELLTEAILGIDYKNIKKPAVLVNIWPLESKESEKVAKILSLELVDETKMMGSYYRMKLGGGGREGMALLVNKGAGDEVIKIKGRQYKFVTEIRSDEIPELKRAHEVKRSGACQIPEVKKSRFDFEFPREMVGEDEVDEGWETMSEKRRQMNNPFKKYYYPYTKYVHRESSTPSDKMTPDSQASSLEKSGSSRGIGILMGEFSEEERMEREMSEEEYMSMVGEEYREFS